MDYIYCGCSDRSAGPPLSDNGSVAGLESDVRIVPQAWFGQDRHESVENFVCSLPVACFSFTAHGRYSGAACYAIDTLFRVFLLKELYGWERETALTS